jgi:hypothetical protein
MTSSKSIVARAPAADNPAESGHDEPNFEARWDAWKARGAAHDLELRRRFLSLAPLAAIIGVTVYILILIW